MFSNIYYLKNRIAIIILLILFLGVQSYSFAQTGAVRGKVYDKDSNELLAGANIIIKGTSLGAATNLDGQYLIRNIPTGKQTLVATYIGYNSDEIEINIPENKTLELDIYLTSKTIEGETVTITAQAQGQKAAINQQITSNTIKNIVSADKIRQLPDDNAASALSRLPGVSLMNGDQVVIRGIQAKMNTVTLNGIQLPSTDMKDRSTELGFVSSNMLSGIEVIKSLTPDLDANTIGGVVNLRLREAPTGFHFETLLQGNYNSQDHTTDNYKVWGSASNRYFDNKLGVFLQANAEQSDDGGDIATAAWLISVQRPYGLAPYHMDTFTFEDQQNIDRNNGGSLILDYALPNGKIIFQNTYAATLSNNTSYRNILNFTSNQINYSMFRDKYGKDLWLNSLQGEYNFGDVKAELTLSHSFSDKYTRTRYGDPGNFFGFLSKNDSQPFGVKANGDPIDYYAQSQFFTPDDVYNLYTNPQDPYLSPIDGWVVTRSEAFKLHLYNTSLDLTVPINFSKDVTSSIKFGGKFVRTTRVNDVEATFKGSSDPDFYYNIANFFPGKTLSVTNPLTFYDIWNQGYSDDRGKYYLNDSHNFKYAYDRDLMDRLMVQSMSGWAVVRHKPSSERDDYNGAEIFSAGYLMGTFNIGPKLTIIGGARFEHYNLDYHAKFVYVTHSVYGYANLYDTLNTVNSDDDHVFPNIHVRYKFADWVDLRLAYTQSISRPDYNATLPNIYFEPGGAAQAGNPKLKPALADNFDAALSFYNNEIGLFTISGFYKKIDNIFYQTNIYYKNLNLFNVAFPDSSLFNYYGAQAPSPSQQISTFINNPHPAHVKGIEFDWQTNFWYLPGPLSALVLNVNYTKAWSDMDYQQVRNIDSTYIDGRFTRHVYITRDTVRTARLLYQGDDVVNIALGIDYKGFSGRISFNMRGNIITTVGSRPETDQYTGNVYKWDIALQQKLPIEGLSVALNGTNIFHNPTKTYQDFRRTVDGPILSNLTSTSYYATTFQFNVRYTF